MSSRAESPYSRLNYRRLIAWPERIEREWPFLRSQLAGSPEPSVIDLGCGTGEHVRHLASQGYRSVGLDRSEEQIAAARDYEDEFGSLGPRFVIGDLAEITHRVSERFGLALCLGNVLPHLEDDVLERVLKETLEVLLPGGRLVVQLLNYERIFEKGIRHLPLNFRGDPAEDGEIVFLRLLRRDNSGDDRHIWFYPTTLTLRPGDDRPVEVEAAREVKLRAWRRKDLKAQLIEGGFEVEATHGDMLGGPYDPESSPDLVLVAVRRAP